MLHPKQIETSTSLKCFERVPEEEAATAVAVQQRPTKTRWKQSPLPRLLLLLLLLLLLGAEKSVLVASLAAAVFVQG